MPPKETPDTTPPYAPGDRVTVTLPTDELVDATISDIVHSHKGPRYLVDYGRDLSALVEPWRLHPPTNWPQIV